MNHRERNNREDNREKQNVNITKSLKRKYSEYKFIKELARKYYQQYIFIV